MLRFLGGALALVRSLIVRAWIRVAELLMRRGLTSPCPIVVRRAVAALAGTPPFLPPPPRNGRLLSWLLLAVVDSDEVVTKRVRRAIMRHCYRADDTFDTSLDVLRDPQCPVEVRSLVAGSLHPDERRRAVALDAYLVALEDAVSSDQLAAMIADALARCGSERAVGPLASLLAPGFAPEVRRRALDALQRLLAEQPDVGVLAIHVLLETLGADGPVTPEGLGALSAVLGRADRADLGAVQRVAHLVGTERVSPPARRLAVEALAAVNSLEAWQVLNRWRDDPDLGPHVFRNLETMGRVRTAVRSRPTVTLRRPKLERRPTR